MHYIYKYVLNNNIIYIGKTDAGLENRLSQHGKPGDNITKDAWEELNVSEIFYATMANATMADVVESELIRRYQPKYNKAKMDTAWAGLPFAEPEWTKYVPQTNVPSHNRDEKVPGYMQLPHTSTKRNELKYRISTDFSAWIILNAIKRYNMLPGNTYDFSKIIDMRFINIIYSYSYHGKSFPMITEYLSAGKNDKRCDLLTISKNLYSHCTIDDVLLYYKDRLTREINYLKEAYPSSTYDVKTKKRGYRPIDDIIRMFETCCDDNGIAV